MATDAGGGDSEPGALPKNQRRWLVAALVAVTAILWVTAIPETFTVDECNYFATVRALRHGTLFVPGTEDLSPTRELVGFDPVSYRRDVEAGRIAPTAPPLYAPLALPSSFLGWRWLILLNALGFAATAWLVFRITARACEARHTPWVAIGLFVLGGFGLDYAQAAWPHMITVGLTTTAVWLALFANQERGTLLAAAAGVCAGWAAGIRYQNIVFGAAVGLALFIWSDRRWRKSIAYGAGLVIPLAVSSLINAARLGTYNPVSKGTHYLPGAPSRKTRGMLEDVLGSFWARVVDYSSHPPFGSEMARSALPKDPDTGVFLVVGGLKKALLQSAPWIALALLALALAWTERSRVVALSDTGRRAVRQLAVPIICVLALFSWAGLERHDGWSFNQRYLLELVPLFAIVAALGIDGEKVKKEAIGRAVIGGAIGIGVATIPVVAAVPEHHFRQRMLMFAPLVIAAALVGVWLAGRRALRLRLPILAAAAAWALVVHVGDDMRASRGLRDWNGFQRAVAAKHLPGAPAALIAISPAKEAMCPLHVDHDLVMVDPGADGAESLHALTGELLAQGRRVFVMGGLPEPWLARLFEGRRVKMLAMRPMPIAEVLPGQSDASAGGDASLQQRKPVE